MSDSQPDVAIVAVDAPLRTLPSSYPAMIAHRMAGREKRPLGDLFGLRNFGVNLTSLGPGAVSSFRHAHARQDEFIYVLEGTPLLHTDAGTTRLAPGMCAGFRAGTGDAHRVVNDTPDTAWILEIGDRTADESVTYPDDDLMATIVDGRWVFAHKDGTPW